MGALFGYMEGIQKKIIWESLEASGGVPAWCGPFADVDGPLDYARKLKLEDKNTGIELVGIPDLVFTRPDGTAAVVDLKTAYHKKQGDSLFPMYQVQVNAYAYLIEHQEGAPKISKAGLLHFEVDRGLDPDSDCPEESETGIWAHFRANPVEVELSHYVLIPRLLKKVKAICSLPERPQGKEGCRDCATLNAWAQLIAKDGGTEFTDMVQLFRLADQHGPRTNIVTSGLSFAPDGVFANWESD